VPEPGNPPRIDRRALLRAAPLLAVPLFAIPSVSALAGCSGGGTGSDADRGAPPAAPSIADPTQAITDAGLALAALEGGFGGRIGVYALDTGSSAEIRHRADERFPLCSTFKALAAAATLRLDSSQPGLLQRRVHWTDDDVVGASPVTASRGRAGMTVAELCAAAIIQSDSTAANQLLLLLGGPAQLTAFARTLGDQLTQLDRREPAVNDVPPGTTRDTTTPAQMAADLRLLVLGDALPPSARNTLTDWMVHSATGADRIRAGLPGGWRVADKTGTGNRAEANDIAVVWPPRHAPLVISIYTAPANQRAAPRSDILASAAATVVKAFTSA
jgi:beta-lactamase class A